MSLDNVIDERVLNVGISETSLSMRVKNVLNKIGVNTIEQLVKIPEERLLYIRGFGAGSLQDLRETIYKNGELRSYEEITGYNALTNPEMLNMPLQKSIFPLRVRRAIQRLGIITVGELIKTEDIEFLAIKNFGQTSLLDMKRIIRNYGLEPYKHDKSMTKKARLRLNARIERIRDLAEKGLTRKEIAEASGMIYRYVTKIIGNYGLEVRSSSYGLKIRPEIDRMIVAGDSICEMAKETEQSKQLMSHYIHARRAHEYWRRQREKRIRREKSGEIIENKRNEIVAKAVYGVLENAARNENDFAVRKAIEYKIKYPKTSRTFEQLEKIFRAYKEADERGEKLSLEEIGKTSNAGIIYASSIGDILKGVGLEPMYGTNDKRSPLSTDELKAVARVGCIGMGALDLSYFIGLNWWNIVQTFRRNNAKRLKIKPFIKKFGALERTSVLSYRLASQIYEARDAGYFTEFSRSQMAEFFDTSREAVDYTFEHENKISPKITSVLGKIYLDRRSKKPYRTKSDVL